MRFAISLVVLMSLVLGACGGRQAVREEPDWVNGVSGRYPASSYLTGRGEGKTLDEAKDRARADLVKTLEVEVQAKTKDVTNFSSVTKDDETRSETTGAVTREIRTSTQKIVKGVEMGDVWASVRGGNHFALAILSRTKAGGALKEEIKQLDDATGLHMRAAEAQGDLIIRMAHLNKAASEQRSRNELQAMLQVIELSGRGIDSVYPLPKITALMDVGMSGIGIEPVGSGSQGAELMAILSGAISKAGFSVARTGAPFSLHADYLQENREIREGWIWLRGTVTLKLVDAKGEVRGTHRLGVKVSAQDDATAAARVRDKISLALNANLRDILLGFFPL